MNLKKFKNCPLCGGVIFQKYTRLRDRFEITKSTFTVYECNDCGIGFLNPMPIGDVSQFYPVNYLSAKSQVSTNSLNKLDLEKWYRYNQYKYDFRLFKRATGISLRDAKSYIDIGCGSGERVTFVKEQGCIKSFGVDKFDFAKNKIKKETEIINSEIINYKPIKKFQISSLFHVLEHVENPREILEHIKKYILDQGGYLIIQVPNYSSIERYVFGRKWFSFDAPRHLWQFNETVLENMLTTGGYKIKKTYKTNATLHPITTASSIWRELDIQRIWVVNADRGIYRKILELLWVCLTILTIPLSIVQNILKKSSMLTIIVQNIE